MSICPRCVGARAFSFGSGPRKDMNATRIKQNASWEGHDISGTESNNVVNANE